MKVGVVALAVLALAGAAGAATPGANVGLVFTQDLGDLASRTVPQQYLCASRTDGGAPRKVTRGPRAVDPDVSPSGAELAYVAASSGHLGVLERVPSGGGAPTRPAGDLAAGWPAWGTVPWFQPPRDFIYFAGTGTTSPSGDLDIYRVAGEGGPPVRIVGGPRREAMPAVHPFGGSLLFVRSDPSRPVEAGGELWWTSAQDDPHRTESRLLDRDDVTSPDYSPDGGQIAFSASGTVYVFTPHAWPAPTLVALARGTEPEFSPDGRRIAFVRDGDVWTMSATGGDEQNVTHSSIAEGGPTWQGTAVPTGTDEPCALVGTTGDDTVLGSRHADVYVDQAGNDVVRLGDGDDLVLDAEGSDRYETGAGADRVALAGGQNAVDGGPGNDLLVGGNGPDRMLGGDGADRIYGNGGPDLLFGGPGNDRIEGNRGDDHLDGGLGHDVLYGGVIAGLPRRYDGYDVLLGRGGNDRLAGGWQKDRLFGGAGNDRLRGGPHGDHLVGDAGADDIGGEAGDDLVLARDRRRDRVSGGPGFDRARLDAADRRGGIERRLR